MRAQGYVEGELFLGKVAERQSVDGLVIKLRREGRGADADHVRLDGKVTRGGDPVRSGRVSAWWQRYDYDRASAPILRGRTVLAPATEMLHSAVRPDGSYAIDNLKILAGRPGHWFLTFEEPGHAPAVLGPLPLKAGERQRTFDIDAVEGGSLEGRVVDLPESMAGQVWVIAFNETMIRREARVRVNGTFRLDNLPPGRYGLKVGHDAYQDPHIPGLGPAWEHTPAELAELRKKSEPWQGAVEASVRSGETTRDVVVDFRPPGPLIER